MGSRGRRGDIRVHKQYSVCCVKSGISTTCVKCYHGSPHTAERGEDSCMNLGDCHINGKDINVKCEKLPKIVSNRGRNAI